MENPECRPISESTVQQSSESNVQQSNESNVNEPSEKQPSLFGRMMMIITKIKNMCLCMCGNVSNLTDNKYVSIYVKLLMMLSTFILYSLNYITTTMMNVLYFSNVMLNTVRYFYNDPKSLNNSVDNEKKMLNEWTTYVSDSNIINKDSLIENQPSFSPNEILNEWLIYSNVTIIFGLFDTMTNFLDIGLIRLSVDLLKLYLYHSLMSNRQTAILINEFVVKIYSLNRYGIEWTKYKLLTFVNYILSLFNKNQVYTLYDTVKLSIAKTKEN